MKSSIDFFNEYVEANSPHGQKALAALCEVTQDLVSMWKKRGGMTPAATVHVGLALGYPPEMCYQIALIEAERTESGRSFLRSIASKGAKISASFRKLIALANPRRHLIPA